MQIKKHRKTTGPPPISGIIMPSKWNEQRIAIHTDDQKEYEIGFSGVGKELINLTNKKVVIQGKLRLQLNGREMLSVQQYQILTDTPENSVAHLQEG